MKSTAIKKIIALIGAVLLISGISVFAYWMSELNKPDDKDIDFNIIIGVGGDDGTNLIVQDVTGNFNFVPLGREDDSIGDNNESSFVFDVNVRWEHDPEDGDEEGLLRLSITNFVIYESDDPNETEATINLSEELLAELISLFTIEIGTMNGEEFVKDDDFYIGHSMDTNVWETLKVKITFANEPTNKQLRLLLLEKKYDLIVTIEITHIRKKA